MSRRNWTAAEDATLRDLLAKGVTNAAIARKIGRPESSVYSRTEVLASQARPAEKKAGTKVIPQQVKTERPCMCCGHPFQSEGPHHRLCSECRRIPTTRFDH